MGCTKVGSVCHSSAICVRLCALPFFLVTTCNFMFRRPLQRAFISRAFVCLSRALVAVGMRLVAFDFLRHAVRELEAINQSTISTHPLLATQTTAWRSNASISSCSVDSKYALAIILTACLAIWVKWSGLRHGEHLSCLLRLKIR